MLHLVAVQLWFFIKPSTPLHPLKSGAAIAAMRLVLASPAD
jgi:hypothetical protein